MVWRNPRPIGWMLAPPPPAVAPSPDATASPAPMPPWWRRARNALGAAGQVAAHLRAGHGVRVSREERERRLAVCQQCEPWYDAQREVCRHPRCGCYMRFKTWLVAVDCPDRDAQGCSRWSKALRH